MAREYLLRVPSSPTVDWCFGSHHGVSLTGSGGIASVIPGKVRGLCEGKEARRARLMARRGWLGRYGALMEGCAVLARGLAGAGHARGSAISCDLRR